MKHFQRFGCWPDTVKVRLSVWECSGIAGPLRWATANGPKPQHRKLQPETRGTETRANRALRRIPAQRQKMLLLFRAQQGHARDHWEKTPGVQILYGRREV
jgi:hypothetical protein